MKLTKQDTEFGMDIILEEDNKQFMIYFAGNLDLYWKIVSNEDNNKHSFIITKENYDLYRIFDELYSDIENVNVLVKDLFLDKKIDYDEEKIRLCNRSNYNELFDDENKTITWYSDETAHEVSNILKIKKEEDIFKIEFYVQPYISGYDRDFNSPNHISIRFRNSGSYYKPFNFLFMKMYNKLKTIDDINDYGHQMNIEEYLYNKVKKLTK